MNKKMAIDLLKFNLNTHDDHSVVQLYEIVVVLYIRPNITIYNMKHK